MTNEEKLARDIVRTLTDAGFEAYFAGGWVRDRMLGIDSSDIDIATSAPPIEVQRLFPKTVPIGIAFGIILVVLEGHSFEVATFREDTHYLDGRRPEGVVFATKEEDAMRRDFTINGLFYDPQHDKVLDFVGGIKDIEQKIIRTIGDPKERFAEDRLRMIRAVRLYSTLNFSIEKSTQDAISHFASSLTPAVAVERIIYELKKIAEKGNFLPAMKLLFDLGLLTAAFPELEKNRDDLEKKIARLPEKGALILRLYYLFPEKNKKEWDLFFDAYKLSRDEKHLLFTHLELQKLLKASLETDPVSWVHFFANPKSDAVLEAEIAYLRDSAFEEAMKKKREDLLPHIIREETKNPLITSGDLVKRGISPGKAMGELLQKAKSIAIIENLHDKQTILKKIGL